MIGARATKSKEVMLELLRLVVEGINNMGLGRFFFKRGNGPAIHALAGRVQQLAQPPHCHGGVAYARTIVQ